MKSFLILLFLALTIFLNSCISTFSKKNAVEQKNVYLCTVFINNYLLSYKKLLEKMKKVLLFVAVVATIGFASCTNKQAEAEKAKADSLAEVARLDSIAQEEARIADSIAMAAADTLAQAAEEVPAN